MIRTANFILLEILSGVQSEPAPMADVAALVCRQGAGGGAHRHGRHAAVAAARCGVDAAAGRIHVRSGRVVSIDVRVARKAKRPTGWRPSIPRRWCIASIADPASRRRSLAEALGRSRFCHGAAGIDVGQQKIRGSGRAFRPRLRGIGRPGGMVAAASVPELAEIMKAGRGETQPPCRLRPTKAIVASSMAGGCF